MLKSKRRQRIKGKKGKRRGGRKGKKRNQNKSLNLWRLIGRLPFSFSTMIYLLNPSDNHLIIPFQSQFSTYGIPVPFISKLHSFPGTKRKLLPFLYFAIIGALIFSQILEHSSLYLGFSGSEEG